MQHRSEVPVVIAGGGLVGLSTAMFLAQHRVPSLAIERLREGSQLPRAAHFHVRTLEVFRAAGIEEAVKEQSLREFLPEGAIVAMDSLAGRKLADIIPSINIGVDDALTPCRRLFVSQPGLEPILRRRADVGGAEVLDGHEIVGVEQDDDGVTVTARDVDTGAEVTQRARYMLAADGAHSVVREALGIPFEGRGTFSNSITIYFTADLWPQMGDKPLSVIYINNPAFGGFFRLSKDCQTGFLVVNTLGDPSAGPVGDAAADTSEARLIDLVRIGAGVPDLAVRIDGVARWRASTDVAGRYQHGRVFLAGDAAHVMPPNGGFGGNTGIADAYDVAWKLALAVKGVAGPGLLATYEQERRPVGRLTVEQAYARYVTRTATYLGATDHQPVLPDLEIELGYVYRSPAVSTDGGDPTVDHVDPRAAHGRPGTRAPHLWIDDGGPPRSTLDLMGRHFVLLTGSAGDAWRAAAATVTDAVPGIALDVHQLGDGGWHVREGSFTESHDVDEDGAVLVRPDGFVAWRAAQAGTAGHAEALETAVRTALQAS